MERLEWIRGRLVEQGRADLARLDVQPKALWRHPWLSDRTMREAQTRTICNGCIASGFCILAGRVAKVSGALPSIVGSHPKMSNWPLKEQEGQAPSVVCGRIAR
ncbi:uncharacterized protein STAUR_2480 [Stigmatella aurantiaca DW4/3-1]|uniref:Uncharacterized protein n=1 Tax=Stigmatella aurantiaca (strain DW4/3-1) TaxID=378806 RepID=E3FGE9_STIAD|nr:uncharacterized protein STAUR_2480 [Stigmatella aurantiaca DW4/3-1]